MGWIRGRLIGGEKGAVRDDCPHGFWIPAEFLAGGQNASGQLELPLPFRCGDCGFPPTVHERDRAVPGNPSSGSERDKNTQFQSQKSYFESFRA